MATPNVPGASDYNARVAVIINLFIDACAHFSQALERSDNLLDATDFTGSLHVLALTAGRVKALGEVLTLLSGNPDWTQRADEVLAEYMQPAASSTEGEQQ